MQTSPSDGVKDRGKEQESGAVYTCREEENLSSSHEAKGRIDVFVTGGHL